MAGKLLIPIVMVFSGVFAFSAEGGVRHFTMPMYDGDEVPMDYYVRLPDGYDDSKPYPLLFCVPGMGMQEGDASNNQARRYVQGFAKQPSFKNFIIYSIWFNTQTGTYPHPNNSKAAQAAEKITDHILATYNIDRERVFMEFFSGGGAFSDEFPFKTYAVKAPFELAGILFTSANCWGPNAGAACVGKWTQVFIEVGDQETVKNVGVDMISDARNFESRFKNKAYYLELHIIKGQKHVISADARQKIDAFVDKVMKDVDKRQETRLLKNVKRAKAKLKKGDFGAVYTLTKGATALKSDSPKIGEAQRIAAAISARVNDMKSRYVKQLETDPAKAIALAMAMAKMFKRCEIGQWAASELKKLGAEKKYATARFKAGTFLRDIIKQETAAIRAAAAPPAK